MKQFLLRVLAGFLLSTLTAAAEWPKGFVLSEDSTSPDGRFAVLIPSRETGSNIADDGSPELVNYLVEVKAGRLLGKIKGGDYWQGENHSGMEVEWAADSTWVVVRYEGRYGFASIHILQPTAKGFTQAEIGARVHSALGGAMAKASHGKVGDCDGNVISRLGADGQLRLRVIAMNNSKQLEEIPTFYAFFDGTYDVKAGRWKAAAARPMESEYDVLDKSLREVDFAGRTWPNEEDRAETLDELLNDAYQAARFLLPPERFAAVKREQLAWLKQRDAAGSLAAKCTLLEARIKALRALLW